MSTVKAYYDGITFFPIETLNIPVGKVVNLTNLTIDKVIDFEIDD